MEFVAPLECIFYNVAAKLTEIVYKGILQSTWYVGHLECMLVILATVILATLADLTF